MRLNIAKLAKLKVQSLTFINSHLYSRKCVNLRCTYNNQSVQRRHLQEWAQSCSRPRSIMWKVLHTDLRASFEFSHKKAHHTAKVRHDSYMSETCLTEPDTTAVTHGACRQMKNSHLLLWAAISPSLSFSLSERLRCTALHNTLNCCPYLKTPEYYNIKAVPKAILLSLTTLLLLWVTHKTKALNPRHSFVAFLYPKTALSDRRWGKTFRKKRNTKYTYHKLFLIAD